MTDSPSLLPELRTADFDFGLPDALIAQHPAQPRDSARLLVLAPGSGVQDHIVSELPDLLRAGDLLVSNDTRVIPARLRARRGEAAVEVMLNRAEGGGVWHALIRNARRLRPGDVLRIEGAPELAPRVLSREGGGALLDFGPDEQVLAAALDRAGEVPLPPYIDRPQGPSEGDRADYQTVFAARPGAVAAPTASLHLTPAMLDRFAARGIGRIALTLHVGAGTFLPVRDEDPRAHRIHAEWGEVTPDAAGTFNAARREGRRIVALGTTALRLLETACDDDGALRPFRGLTDIFLLPGHRFRGADLLLTNFHLPRSTLLMLACAFAGTGRVMDAYARAVARGYRFFSYGDATLLTRAELSPEDAP